MTTYLVKSRSLRQKDEGNEKVRDRVLASRGGRGRIGGRRDDD